METVQLWFYGALDILQLGLEYVFVSWFIRSPVKGGDCLLFSAMAAFFMRVVQAQQLFPLNITVNILLLTLMGVIVLGGGCFPSLLAAGLAVEIMYLSFGITNYLLCVLGPLTIQPNGAGWSWVLASAAALGAIGLAFLCYQTIQRRFTLVEGSRALYESMIFLPLLLVLFWEEYIFERFYGNVVTINERGQVLGDGGSIQIFILQILALCSVFSVLYAYRRLMENFREKARLAALEQESRMQREYVAEAKTRYEHTRAFRHDIKNHLIVLRGLLAAGDMARANGYLEKLESMTAGLSFPCQTNCPVLDILLESKLGLAIQNGVEVQCALEVPSECPVDDIDLCIVLSNALDNAIKACGKQGYIRIHGEGQGDFFMIALENSCLNSGENRVVFGTGLSNIKAVAERYGGAVRAEQRNESFCLNVLFNLSQHPNDISG